MAITRRTMLAGLAGATALPGRLSAQQPPGLSLAFTLAVKVAPAVELGTIDGARRRFVPIIGGLVSGPRLSGEVLPHGGDWQTIRPGGLTEVVARYFLKAADGTIIGVENSGVRVASEAVTADLARGLPVDPKAYYFRTTPRFDVAPGPYGWLRTSLFTATGIRRPDLVEISVFSID